LQLPGFPQKLGENLTLKYCASEHDIRRVSALNGEIHGEEARQAVDRWLLDGHPQIVPAGWFFVEHQPRGQVVATLCLIPMTWRYGPVSLPVAELGFVATRPEFRKRGLQRALSAAFDRVALANGYALAGIEGIPFFYRQFGYEYALPLSDCRYRLSFEQVPAGPTDPYTFRPAQFGDIPLLMDYFERHNQPLAVTTERSAAMWRYYIELMVQQVKVEPGETGGVRPHLILRNQQPGGYVGLIPSGWSNRLNIAELALDEPDALPAALTFARQQAQARQHDGLGLYLPAEHPACTFARQLGVIQQSGYAWQMKILDPVAFLNQIAPTLEERLAQSAEANYSGTLNFNLYRQRVGLNLTNGKINAVKLDEGSEIDASMPPQAACQLWLNWKPWAALDEWYKDANCKAEKRELLETLFPPAESHIYLSN
jgi:predicted N-acetyltransferase YhbS